MKKLKLLQAIASCTEEEMGRLEDFLQSPYFNKDKQVLSLFHLLKPFYPSFESAELTKFFLYQQLFPDEAYDDKRLRYLMSSLNKLIEQFFALQVSESNYFESQLNLLSNLSARQLDKAYAQISRRLEQELENSSTHSTDYYWRQMRWAEIREEHFERQRKRQFDESIADTAHYLDRYYFLHRLKLSCAMLDRQTIFRATYDLRLSEGWVEYLKEQQFFNESIIELYFTIFQALRFKEQERYFGLLQSFLNENTQALPKEDLKNAYLFTINYCARKIREGKSKYTHQALDLYLKGIKEQVLVDNGELSPWTFTNVVKLLLRIRAFERAEHFIRQYAPSLPLRFRENALHYNLAELYYYTQRFGEAQLHLNQVAYSDLNYYLGARVMLAKIYHESGAEEPLLSLLAAFTIFLKRNKQIS
ncbi:MAG: hypothetical protein MRY78_08445, partial [Saprospiraceae bacterium]|nr:hypothetical protein [Saprospiraceae bacterium]